MLTVQIQGVLHLGVEDHLASSHSIHNRRSERALRAIPIAFINPLLPLGDVCSWHSTSQDFPRFCLQEPSTWLLESTYRSRPETLHLFQRQTHRKRASAHPSPRKTSDRKARSGQSCPRSRVPQSIHWDKPSSSQCSIRSAIAIKSPVVIVTAWVCCV